MDSKDDTADAKQFTDMNRKYWDKMAETYNSKPWQITLNTRITAEIHSKTAFINANWDSSSSSTATDQKATRLLDYACGTGLVSRALAPYITTTTGIDISSAMVDKFNAAFDPSIALQDPTAVPGEAVVGNLLVDPPDAELDEEQFFDFDVAAVGLGFHHFATPEVALRRLVERVVRGSGVVLIIDWLLNEGDGGGHAQDAEAHKTIRTNGFTEQGMRSLFEAAGCTDFGFSVMKDPVELIIGEPPRSISKIIFLARGTRAA